MRKLILALWLIPSISLAEPNLQEGIASLAEGDYNNAIINLQPLALDGNSEAQFKMCGMYYLGSGVPHNPQEAVNWCKLAAARGHVEAAYNLGLFYQKGDVVQTDLNESIKWYKFASERGHSDATFNLAQIENSIRATQQYPQTAQPQMMQLPPQLIPIQPQVYYAPVPTPAAPAPTPTAPKKSVNTAANKSLKLQEYCLVAAQRGNPDPKCDYEYPGAVTTAKITSKSLDENIQPASKGDLAPDTVEWYIKQAGLGNIQAQNNLGVIYRRGKGVDKDPKEAFKWFEKAAARGSTKGMMNLASMYKNGEGVKQNLELAYSWFNLAADRVQDEKQKTIALSNVQEISKHMNNQQIGDALNYVTKLDDTIPILDERTQDAEPATKPKS